MNTTTSKISTSSSASVPGAEGTKAGQTPAPAADSMRPRNPRAVPLPVENNAQQSMGENAAVNSGTTEQGPFTRAAATIDATRTSSRPTASATPAADAPYGVGYKKPPEQTRFMKGQSGNPKGRPKGSQNFQTIFLTASNAKVPIIENGKTSAVSKREVIAKALVNKAAKGDPRALDTYLKLDERFNPVPASETP